MAGQGHGHGDDEHGHWSLVWNRLSLLRVLPISLSEIWLQLERTDYQIIAGHVGSALTEVVYLTQRR